MSAGRSCCSIVCERCCPGIKGSVNILQKQSPVFTHDACQTEIERLQAELEREANMRLAGEWPIIKERDEALAKLDEALRHVDAHGCGAPSIIEKLHVKITRLEALAQTYEKALESICGRRVDGTALPSVPHGKEDCMSIAQKALQTSEQQRGEGGGQKT